MLSETTSFGLFPQSGRALARGRKKGRRTRPYLEKAASRSRSSTLSERLETCRLLPGFCSAALL